MRSRALLSWRNVNVVGLVALALLLATPAVMIWAGKAQIVDTTGDEGPFEQQLMQDEARRMASLGLPEATLPPAEFSPFGGALTPRRLSADKAGDTLHSPIGDVEWDPDRVDITASLKPGLRWGANDITRMDKGVMRPAHRRFKRGDCRSGKDDPVNPDW